MNKTAAAILTFMAMAALVTATVIGTIFNVSMNTDFYGKQHEKLNVSAVTGMSANDMDRAMSVCLGYLVGDNDDLFVEADVFGVHREVFNEREKAHMVDVRTLYRNADTVKNVCWATAALLIVTVMFFTRRSRRLKYPHTMCKSALMAEGTVAAVIAAIGLYAALDFDTFWTKFHGVFFSNDLWLMDPSTDIMIQLLPGELFDALVLRIVIRCILIFAVFAAALIWAMRRRKDVE